MDYRLVDLYSQLSHASSIEQAWELYFREMEKMGFQHGLYGLVMHHLVEDSSQFVLSNYSESFSLEYENLGGPEADATAIWCLKNDGYIKWNSPVAMKLLEGIPKDTTAIEELSESYGIRNGLSLSMRQPKFGQYGGVGLSATGIRDKEFDRDIYHYRDYIVQASCLFETFAERHLKTGVMADLERDKGQAITPSEFEVLRWLAAGFKLQEIADEKVYRSIDSINLYVRSLKKKMNARTVDQLVAKAVGFKLI